MVAVEVTCHAWLANEPLLFLALPDWKASVIFVCPEIMPCVNFFQLQPTCRYNNFLRHLHAVCCEYEPPNQKVTCCVTRNSLLGECICLLLHHQRLTTIILVLDFRTVYIISYFRAISCSAFSLTLWCNLSITFSVQNLSAKFYSFIHAPFGRKGALNFVTCHPPQMYP